MHKLFQQSGYIKSYSTTKTADRVFARERLWRDNRQDERKLILDDYTADLRRKEEERERETRTRNIEALTLLVKELEITVSTTWRAAHNLILAAPTFKEDEELSQIETIDMLQVFDDYMRQLEQENEEETRKFRVDQVRTARKAREGFKALLSELESRGELKRTTKWKDIFPSFKHDERYLATLGQPGSTAMELWMDAVDDLNEEIERAAAKIERAVVDIKVDTTFDQFESMIKDAHLDTQVDVKMRKEAYDLILERLKQQAADEERRAERKRRHRMEDLRYALRKVKAIEVDTSYEDVSEILQQEVLTTGCTAYQGFA